MIVRRIVTTVWKMSRKEIQAAGYCQSCQWCPPLSCPQCTLGSSRQETRQTDKHLTLRLCPYLYRASSLSHLLSVFDVSLQKVWSGVAPLSSQVRRLSRRGGNFLRSLLLLFNSPTGRSSPLPSPERSISSGTRRRGLTVLAFSTPVRRASLRRRTPAIRPTTPTGRRPA